MPLQEDIIRRALSNRPTTSTLMPKFGTINWKTITTTSQSFFNKKIPQVQLYTSYILPFPGMFPEEWDTDLDGIPDNWELNYFDGLEEINHFTTDSNNNGLTNAEEFILGLNPIDSNSKWDPELNVDINRIFLKIPMTANRLYTVFLTTSDDQLNDQLITEFNGSEIYEDNTDNNREIIINLDDYNNPRSFNIRLSIQPTIFFQNLDPDPLDINKTPSRIPPSTSSGTTIYTSYEP